jgi:TRAP-type C4-dicarboxylate transport system permease small subunit
VRCLKAVQAALARGTSGLALLAGWALLGLAGLITFEVFARKFFGFSLQGADEISGFVLAIASTIGFAYALHLRAHIRIDVVLVLLPTPVQALLNVLAYLLFTYFTLVLAYEGTWEFVKSIRLSARSLSPMAVPLAWPQGIWSAALIFFAVVATAELASAIGLVASGRFREAAIRFGPPSLQREVEEEMAAARRRLSEQGARTP